MIDFWHPTGRPAVRPPVLPAHRPSHGQFGRVSRALARHATTVVVDCGPAGSPGARAAVATADQFVLVTDARSPPRPYGSLRRPRARRSTGGGRPRAGAARPTSLPCCWWPTGPPSARRTPIDPSRAGRARALPATARTAGKRAGRGRKRLAARRPRVLSWAAGDGCHLFF